MEQNLSNVLLVLMRLDVNDPHPLRAGAVELGADTRLLDKDKSYHLLVGVLDPSQRATSAPVTAIELSGTKLRTYNQVLRRFKKISARFYDEGGFIDKKQSYTNDRQADVLEAMSQIGRGIYDLFQSDKNPVRDWLDKLLKAKSLSKRERPIQPVTVVTNDFSIPWFWLKREETGPFLCEVCSLGLLQLSAAGGDGDLHSKQPGRADRTYQALLINGSDNLPFAQDEMEMIRSRLQHPERRLNRVFMAYSARSFPDIVNLWEEFREDEMVDSFRIVHFSGHYSGDHLLLGGKPIAEHLLKPVMNNSILVLDGCSSGRGLQAWTDVEGLTSTLINRGGALGCVVTVLPVKHDPIISRLFWGTFYRDLRQGTGTVGQALVKARIALRDHFESLGSQNPTWALYQLIGSPAVQLVDEDDESNG